MAYSELDLESKNKNFNKTNIPGLVVAALTGGFAVLLTVIAAPFVSPALRKVCLPYVPATDQQVINILKALEGRSGKFVDLGSGDGRIVFSIVKNLKNVQGTGIELNPFLVWYSRILAWNKGVRTNTSFIKRDLWKSNLSQFDNVIVFGVSEMMPDLQSKLYKELCPDARIFACRFPLPAWKPIATVGEGIDTVWIYQKPSEVISDTS